jgi:hypothetical protein
VTSRRWPDPDHPKKWKQTIVHAVRLANYLRRTGMQLILLNCFTVSLNTGVTFRDFAASRSSSANAERGEQRQYYCL